MGENPTRQTAELKRRFVVAALAIALTVLAGCTRPTTDQSTLKAIKAECQALMMIPPIESTTDPDVPKSRWPHVIASLKPEFVMILSQGVFITVKPYFDGGWGYFVPRSKGDRPPPGDPQFSEIGQGVYWFHPY
ncbi:MAG TPA: hypothetical protein VGT78_11800 [Rhizomicrobium sp.]|nr:hypothetical protein [Rhizomicrobium sp.]